MTLRHLSRAREEEEENDGCTHLNVVDEFAKHETEEPCLRDVLNHRGRQAEDEHEQIGSGQVHDEHIRHRSRDEKNN